MKTAKDAAKDAKRKRGSGVSGFFSVVDRPETLKSKKKKEAAEAEADVAKAAVVAAGAAGVNDKKVGGKIKFKFQKGFTNAVRRPVYLADLI